MMCSSSAWLARLTPLGIRGLLRRCLCDDIKASCSHGRAGWRAVLLASSRYSLVRRRLGGIGEEPHDPGCEVLDLLQGLSQQAGVHADIAPGGIAAPGTGAEK